MASSARPYVNRFDGREGKSPPRQTALPLRKIGPAVARRDCHRGRSPSAPAAPLPPLPSVPRGHDRVPAPPGVDRRLGRGSFSIDVAELVKAPKLRHPGLDPGSIPLPWKQPIAPGDSTASDWSVTAASMIWNGSWLGGRDDEASIFATFFPRLCRQHDLRTKSRTRCVNLVDAVRRAITAASWNSLRAAGICRMMPSPRTQRLPCSVSAAGRQRRSVRYERGLAAASSTKRVT